MARAVVTNMEVEDGVLRVEASGVFALADAAAAMEEVVAASARFGVSRVLIDIRTLVGTVSALERLEFGKTLAELTKGDIAIVLFDSLDRV